MIALRRGFSRLARHDQKLRENFQLERGARPVLPELAHVLRGLPAEWIRLRPESRRQNCPDIPEDVGTSRFANGGGRTAHIPIRDNAIGSRARRIEEIKRIGIILLPLPADVAVREKRIHPDIPLRKGKVIISLGLIGGNALFLIQFRNRYGRFWAIETFASVFRVS